MYTGNAKCLFINEPYDETFFSGTIRNKNIFRVICSGINSGSQLIDFVVKFAKVQSSNRVNLKKLKNSELGSDIMLSFKWILKSKLSKINNDQK